MLKLNKKKYVGFLLILILVICIIGITILSKHDKFKGLVKVKNARVLTSVGNTSLTTSKGYDFVNYSLSYTLDNVEGITKRDVIIKATLNDQDSIYARFKEFNDSKYTTVLSDNGKSIEVTGHDITLGEEQNLSLLLVIENAPNGVSITPKIQIKEATGTYTNINTQSIKVETNSVEGYVRDENLMSVSNIELSISKNGREIKRTYTNSEGRFIFTDLTPDNYEIKVEEDIYELLGNNKIQVQNSSNINLSVRQVESYNIKTKKYISKLKLVVNGKEKNYNYGEVEKVVQSIEKAKTISGEIEYKIVVQNKGEKPGIVTRVIDEVEPGLTFETSKNSGWEEVDGNLLYRPIEGVSLSKNAKREIKLVLTINNTEEIKTYLNKVTSKGELYEHVVFVLEDEVIKEEDVIEGEYIKEPTTSEENIGWYTDKNYTNKYNFKNSVTKNLILYSKIKPLDIDHTVTFVDKNPETSDETNYEIKTVHDRDKVTRPETDPSYTGYTFKCWAVNNECFDFNTDIKQDTVLESKYTINKYTVLFINNGEEYARREVNYKNQIPSVDEPSVEYFTFTHWSLTDGGDEYNLDTPVTGDITLYAVYTRENFTVNIIDKNPQTSEEVVIDTQTVAKGNKVTRPETNPTKTGYTFECYQDINSTDCYNFNSPVSENMTLVTKYNINKYSVTFINNGTEYKKQEIEYMGLIEAPVNPFKEFFTFKYWSLEENGTEYDITTPVTNNVTLYSVYEKDTYNVKFIDDGRIIRDEDVDAGTLITAETVSKEGYTFKYWTEDGDTAFDFSNPITNSIILNSVYEIINYSINYDLDGGSLPDGIVNPDKYTIISEPITLNNPSKEGYTFIGWTDDNSQTPDTNYVINPGSTGNKNIKANYEKINYTITYNLNGGSLSDGQDNPVKYTIESEKITLNNPSKEGYTFIGWTGSNGTTPETNVSISKGSTGNKEYVANYEAVEYTITYKGLTNDEKTTLNNPATYTIESNNIVLNNPNNRVDTDGDLTEIFIGWKENESTSINITIETGSTGNKEYEAIWQTADEDVYTITYNLNGGTLETENPTSFTKKTNTFTLNNPSKEGYTFIGWTGSNGTTPETNVSVTKGTRENLSFVANYTEIEYTIEYDLKGGVLETANPTSYTITSPSFTLNNPSKTGYTFVGWEGTDLSTENISVTIEQGSIGNRSYVAKYTKNNYTITYNLNGGTVSEENPNSYTVTDTFTLNNPSKEGYTFTGWSGTGLVELTNEVTVPVGNIGNREYTANYTPINYTITYDLDGGTVTEANPESYNIETPTITLNNPTKQGYSFRGWIVNNDDTPDKDYTIQTGSTGNISLKAVYGATEYTITYDLNGGTVTESNPETYTAETETFTLNNPSKEGYTFTGWTGNGISVPTLTISIEKGSYGHKSFVANYTPTLYTITYDLNDGSLGEGVTNPITYTIETPTFTLNNPSKEGHTFSGWTGTNITSPTTEVIIDTGSTGNREYTANYDTIKYTVKFWTKLSSGWTTLKVINDVEYGSTITPPTTNPTKTGYTFKYWSLNDYIDEEYDITQPITRNLDLYPIFERNQYTITYDYNGGTLPEGVTNVESYNVETPTFAIHEPSKEGYTFIGWTGSHSAEPRTNISIYKGSVGNRIYNANYEINKYTVTFMNGNSIFRSSIVEHGSKVEVPDAIPSKIHSVFSKWVDENGIEYNFDTPVTGNLILYAEYKEVESPSISHTPIEWTNDKVTVTITNKGTDGVDYTGYSYMYKIDDGDYQSYTSPFDVSINSTVYAYSVENEITSVEELDEISNIDKINPEIKDVESVSVSKNSVTLSITSRDNESGLGSLNIYKNSVLETTIGITDSVSEDKIIQYTVENLDPNTEYTFNITATDLAGNVSEQGTITITTSEAEIIRLQVIGTNNTLFDDPSQYIEFESFSDLLSSQECSSNQCTVKVVEDVVESVTLLDGQDITVDLNGHNVSSLTENTFEVLGDLTIIDSGSTEGSIKNTVGTAILVSNGGTLTIGEDDADVSITKPYIEGNTYGIKNNGGTVNFYDGKVKASNAISGTVSDTPDGYTASVEKITDGEDVYQVGTLQILSDVEARIGNVYYTTIDEAVNDSKSGSYQDNMSTGNIMDLMKPIGTNTFLYNELEEAYISTNEGQTDATVYTVLDLTNETVVKDLYLKGYLISDLDPELYHFDSANLIVKQGNSSGTTVCTKSFVYAKETVNSCVLTPGSRYYVEINYKKANLYQGAQYANDKFAIKEISLKTYETVSVPEIDSANLVTEYKGLYGFDYDPETRTLRSNNQYTKNTKAYSYMEVDLTNKTGNYDLIINATLDTYGSYNYGDVVVSTSLEEATSYNYNNFIHMNGKSSTPSLVGPYNHTKTLAGGSKYYIQFYYFKDSDYFNDTSDHTAAEYEAIGVKDQFIINSIDLVKVGDESTSIDLSKLKTADQYGFTHYATGYYEGYDPENITQGTYADSYVEIDLTDAEYDQELDAYLYLYSGSNQKYFYITSNNKNANYNNIKSNRDKSILFYDYNISYNYYVDGSSKESNFSNYKYILQKGNKYYVHFAVNGNQTSSSDFPHIRSITLKPVTESLLNIGSLNNSEGTLGGLTLDDRLIDAYGDLRFITKNPNNYVTFNNEPWRIIGVFSVEGEDGTKEDRIKITRDTALPQGPVYDSTPVNLSGTPVNGGQGINEWSQADLMKLLNPGYDSNEEETFNYDPDTYTYSSAGNKLMDNSLYWNKASGFCTTGTYNSYTSCDYSSIGLTSEAKSFIDTVKWNTGAVPYNQQRTVYQLYEAERGNNTTKSSTWVTQGVDDDVERQTTWIGKVGLPYLSDYLMATGPFYSNGSLIFNYEQCLNTNGGQGACTSSNDWLASITGPMAVMNSVYGQNASGYDSYLSYVAFPATTYSGGMPAASMYYQVKPTVYLKTNTVISSGTGSSTDPYILTLGDSKNTASYYGLNELPGGSEEEPNIITPETPTDDYTKVTNRTLYGFEYNSSTNTFTNANAGVPSSTAYSYTTIDLTDATEDLTFDLRYGAICASSGYNSCYYAIVFTDKLATINFDNSSVISGGSDAFLTYESGSSSSSTYSMNPREITLPKGKKYYMQLGFRNKTNNPGQVLWISMTKKNYTATETEATAYNGTVPVVNQEPDTIVVLKNIDRTSPVSIPATKNVTIDLNGYKISSNQGQGTITKYSHTPNINDSGVASGTYASNLSRTDTVTIPGASKLNIEVWFSTESISYDWLAIYPKNVTPSYSNYSQATISGGKLGGGKMTSKPTLSSYHRTYTVNDNSVKFYFRSDGGGNYYGYYAIISAPGEPGYVFDNAGELTIIDSSDSKTGTLESTGYHTINNQSTGNLNIESATVKQTSTYSAVNNDGKLRIGSGGELIAINTIVNNLEHGDILDGEGTFTRDPSANESNNSVAISNASTVETGFSGYTFNMNTYGSYNVSTVFNTTINDKKITFGDITSTSAMFTNASNIEINDSNIDARSSAFGTINNLTINGSQLSSNVSLSTNGTASINDTTITGTFTTLGNTTTEMTDTIITKTISNAGELSINGGEVQCANISYEPNRVAFTNGGTLTIDGEFTTGDSCITGIKNYGTTTIGNKEDNTVSTEYPNIKGTNYGINNIKTESNHTYDGLLNFYDGAISGKENQAISGSINDIQSGYEIVKTVEGTIETITLGEADYVCQIGETKFRSLNLAVDSITGSEETTIKIIRDFTAAEKTIIPEGKNVIVDFDGHVVSSYCDTMFENAGTLSLTDNNSTPSEHTFNGTLFIKNNGTFNYDKTTINFYGKFIENNGTFNMNGGNVNFYNSYQFINNNGNIIINDGNIDFRLTTSSSSSISLISNNENSSITINDVTLGSSTTYGYSQTIISNNSTLIINDGNYNLSRFGYFITNSNTLDVNGGNFTGIRSFIVNNNIEGATANIKNIVSDGTAEFKDNYGTINLEGNTITNISEYTGYYPTNRSNSAILNVKDCNYTKKPDENGYNYYSSIIVSKGTAVFENTTTDGSISVKTGNLEIKSGSYSTITASNSETGSIIPSLKITGGTITAPSNTVAVSIANTFTGTVQIGEKDGTVDVDSPIITGSSAISASNTSGFNFYDGTLIGKKNQASVGTIVDIETDYDVITDSIDAETDMQYLGTDSLVVNTRTNVEYRSLQTAIDTAENGDTLKLLRSLVTTSTSPKYVVEADKDITLDMDGFAINKNNSDVLFENNGKLKINPNSETHSESEYITKPGEYKIDALDYIRGIKSAGTYNYNPKPDQEHLGLKFVDGLSQGKRTYMPSGIPTSFMTENQTMTIDVTFTPQKTSNMMVISNKQAGGCAIGITDKKVAGRCFIDGMERIIKTNYEIETDHMYNAVLTFDGKYLKFYVNGTIVGTFESDLDSTTIKTPTNNTAFMIGAEPKGSTPEGSYFEGYVHLVKVSPGVLTSEEINTNYQVTNYRYNVTNKGSINNFTTESTFVNSGELDIGSISFTKSRGNATEFINNENSKLNIDYIYLAGSTDRVNDYTYTYISCNLLQNSGEATIKEGSINGLIQNNSTGDLILDNIDFKTSITNAGTLTINGGLYGATLTNTGETKIHDTNNIVEFKGTILNSGSSQMTIDNIKLVQGTNNTPLEIADTSNLIINNGTFVRSEVNAATSIVIKASGNSTATINNASADSTVIFNGTIHLGYKEDHIISAVDSSNITINNIEWYSLSLSDTANMTLVNGTINSGVGVGAGSTFTMGVDDSSVSTTKPKINGTLINNGTFNFYDGVIKGLVKEEDYYGCSYSTPYQTQTNFSGPMTGTGTVNTPSNYELATTESVEQSSDCSKFYYNSIYLANTYSVRNLSTGVKYNKLSTAFAEVEDGEELRLMKPLTLLASEETAELASGKDVILDLNGYSIRHSNSLITNNGILTIVDNSDEEIGEISNQLTNPSITNNGTLYIDGGRYSGGNNIVNNGTMKFTHGTIILGDNNIVNNSDLSIMGGTMTPQNGNYYNKNTSGSSIVNSSTGNLDISSGTINAKFWISKPSNSYVIHNLIDNSGSLNITGGNFVFGNYTSHEFGELELRFINNNINATTTITGGTFSNFVYYNSIKPSGLFINNLGEADISNISINNSNISYNEGTLIMSNISSNQTLSSVQSPSLFTNASGTTTVNSSTIVDNNTLANVTGGTLNINNSTITGTGSGIKGTNSGTTNLTNNTITLDGTIATGSIINIYSGDYTSNDSSNAAIEVTELNITGGTLTSTNGTAIKITSGSTVNIGISGSPVDTTSPVIKGFKYGVSNNSGILNFYDGVIKGIDGSVTGIISNVEGGYETETFTDTDNYESKRLKIIGTATNTFSVNGVNYGDLQSAVNAVPENVETNIILNTNYTLTENIVVPMNVTINLYLNGNTLNYDVYSITGDGTLNVKDETYSGVGGAIYKFLANLIGVDLNKKNITIYQMEDGSSLSSSKLYTLYKLVNNEYITVKVNENGIGNYDIGNKTNELRAIKGIIYVNNIGEGQYKLKGSDNKEINFEITSTGLSSNIRENIKTTSNNNYDTAIATLILTIQTGITRIPYKFIISIVIISLVTVFILKIKKKEN